MKLQSPVLHGTYVRLEPLEHRHVDGLVTAVSGETELYRWTVVPQDRVEMLRYVATALSWQEAGTAVPYATVRQSDGVVIGCTRFYDLAHWDWPPDSPRHRAVSPDVGEIGFTWLSPSAIRTAINTEAKLLMLTQAFEVWDMLRICLTTHVLNERSRAAIERIGGQFEGIIRVSKLGPDGRPRDAARYSAVAAEWPAVKDKLQRRLART
jgi:RimJ/RimL family protein N-acetyltransferase